MSKGFHKQRNKRIFAIVMIIVMIAGTVLGAVASLL